MSGVLLKPDRYLKICPERKKRYEVKKPLSQEQKDFLKREVQDWAIRGYLRRFKASGLIDDVSTEEDIKQYGFLFFNDILEKFDLAPYEGKIAEYDVQGENNAKTLEFFFKAYMQKRISWAAHEVRKEKKKKKAQSGDAASYDYLYDDVDHSTSIQEEEYHITGVIKNEVKKLPIETQRFYKEMYEFEMTNNELKMRYEDKFNEHHNRIKKMLEHIKKNHKNDWLHKEA